MGGGKGDGDQENVENDSAEKILIGQGGDNENIKKENVNIQLGFKNNIPLQCRKIN